MSENSCVNKIHDNYINGKWQLGSAGTFFESTNPATGEFINIFPDSVEKDVDKAVAAAKKAYKTWRLVPAPKRAEILFNAAEILKQQKENLANLMTREMGKNLAETRGDVQEAIDMFYFIAGEGRRLYGETTPSEMPDKFAMSVRMPVGVAGLITPWNFPVAIPSWKLAPALVAGNTIVFKPSSETPACAAALVGVLMEAGLKDYPGVINLIFGRGKIAGMALVKHPDVDLISFTGSSETGREIAVECAKTFKRVSLEMGGKNPTIVMDDADIGLAVKSCHWGSYGTCGQRCTASSRTIVHRKILDEFVKAFVERAKNTFVGNGLDPKTEVGPLINKNARQKVIHYIELAEKEGAIILCGGHPLIGEDFNFGYFFEPTVILAPDPNMRINQEEIFGPVTSIIPASSLEEAIDIANNSAYGLSSAIITRDITNAFRAARDLKSGITYINSSTIGAEVHLPFGGVNQTGNGHREGGHVLDFFTEWKTIYIDYSGKLQKAQGIE